VKKLSKEHIKTRDELVAKLQNARDHLDDVISAFNKTMNERWSELQAFIASYNSIVSEAREWLEQIEREIHEFISNHSERWQEDTGPKYEDWRAAFEDVDMSEVDIMQPDDLDLGDAPDHANQLEELPLEPSK
jgi:DNA repair ATPase RecN